MVRETVFLRSCRYFNSGLSLLTVKRKKTSQPYSECLNGSVRRGLLASSTCIKPNSCVTTFCAPISGTLKCTSTPLHRRWGSNVSIRRKAVLLDSIRIPIRIRLYVLYCPTVLSHFSPAPVKADHAVWIQYTNQVKVNFSSINQSIERTCYEVPSPSLWAFVVIVDWLIDLIHRRKKFPTGMISGWVQKVTEHRGTIQCHQKNPTGVVRRFAWTWTLSMRNQPWKNRRPRQQVIQWNFRNSLRTMGSYLFDQ